MRRDVDLDVRVDQRKRPHDHARPQGDLQDSDAVGDFLVTPLAQPAVDLVQLAVDAGFDLIELLVDVAVGGFLDAPGDATEQPGLLDLVLDRSRLLRRGGDGGAAG